MRTAALYGTIAACIAAAILLFSTQGGPEYTVDAFHRFSQHPNFSGPHDGLPVPHKPSHSGTRLRGPWKFDYKRDGRKHGLTESQCDAAFPLLYHEIDRAVKYRRRVGKLVESEVDVGWRGDGIVRASIHANELYIIDAHGVSDHNHRPRSIATLHALDRAVSASSEPLPTIEFTLTDHDSALLNPHGNDTTWAYSRLAHQESLWLMPDFGFWAWPDVGLRSYAELQTALEDSEADFANKKSQLVWRGSLNVGSGQDARKGLLHHSQDQLWSDVQTLDWSNKSNIDERLLTMEDHCAYKFTAQTEGNTYSGRLKYLLNCHSVVLSHSLDWIEHYHHLLAPSGTSQNYIKLKRDFSDLPKTMQGLLQTSKKSGDAQSIADNAKALFRERYLTPAANSCYWRALIRGWASVQGFEPELFEERDVPGKGMVRRRRGAPFESYVIMEAVDWDIPAKARKVCIDE